MRTAANGKSNGHFVGFELSHMRHIYPLPLSCPLRAYLSVAPAHSDISVGSPYPLCSDLPKQMPWFHPLLLST